MLCLGLYRRYLDTVHEEIEHQAKIVGRAPDWKTYKNYENTAMQTLRDLSAAFQKLDTALRGEDAVSSTHLPTGDQNIVDNPKQSNHGRVDPRKPGAGGQRSRKRVRVASAPEPESSSSGSSFDEGFCVVDSVGSSQTQAKPGIRY